MSPYEMRLRQLFDRKSGRGFIVAFDRGLGAVAAPGGVDALGVIETVTHTPANGVLLSPGLAARALPLLAYKGAPSLLIRSDLLLMGGNVPEGLMGGAEEYRLLIQPEQAAALGADIVVLFLVLGYRNDKVAADNARTVAETVQRAHAVGLPVMVETALWGDRVTDQCDPEQLAFACRFSAELGADIIKTQYTGDIASMRDVIASVPVPVMTLGGPRSDSIDGLVATTFDAIEAGSRGAIYGRNIWQADDPAQTAALVAQAVHNGRSGA